MHVSGTSRHVTALTVDFIVLTTYLSNPGQWFLEMMQIILERISLHCWRDDTRTRRVKQTAQGWLPRAPCPGLDRGGSVSQFCEPAPWWRWAGWMGVRTTVSGFSAS